MLTQNLLTDEHKQSPTDDTPLAVTCEDQVELATQAYNQNFRLLWMMPNNLSVEMGWMHRLMSCMRPEIWRVVTNYSTEPRWSESVRVLDLQTEPLGARLKRVVSMENRPEFPGARRAVACAQLKECTHVVIHFVDFAIKLLPFLNKVKRPIAVFCHGVDVTWAMKNYDVVGSPYHPPNYREQVISLGKKVTFLANSEATQGKLEEIGIRSEQIRRFRFGIDEHTGKRPARATEEAISLLYVGRLVDFKGPDLTIRAFAKLVREVPNTRLWIAGDGPMAVACRLLVAELGLTDKVTFLGSVGQETVRKLMSKADVFTLGSCEGSLTGQEEAFGVAILEAMANGLPVVCGRSGGIPEFVHDGNCGLLFHPGSVDAHADALIQLCKDPSLRHQYGKAAKMKVKTQFSVERMRQSILAALST